MVFGLGTTEVIFVIVALVIAIGPKNIPQTIRKILKQWYKFKQQFTDVQQQVGTTKREIIEDIKKEIDVDGIKKEIENETRLLRWKANPIKTRMPGLKKTLASIPLKFNSKKNLDQYKNSGKQPTANESKPLKINNQPSQKKQFKQQASKKKQEIQKNNNYPIKNQTKKKNKQPKQKWKKIQKNT